MTYSEFYDENKQYVRKPTFGDFTTDKILVLTPPDGVKYVRFSCDTHIIRALQVREVDTSGIIINE